MKKLLLILMLVSVVSGVTYTSSQDGNWNDAATWGGGGYPADGDKAIVDHIVTVNVASVCGLNASTDTSLQVNGELVMNADLTVNGITKLRKCTFTQAAGATLLIGGNYGVITDSGSIWNINGTTGSRSTVRAPSGNYWWIDDLSTGRAFYPNFNYADIKRMGNSTQRSYLNGENVSWQLNFDHCLFDSCGGIYIGYDAVPANSTTISIKNCDWRNVQSQYILYLRSLPQDVQGRIQVTGNTFHSKFSGGSRIDFTYISTATDNYIDFRNNILHNVTLNLGRNTTVDSCWSWNPNITYGTNVNFTSTDNFYTVKNSVLYGSTNNAHLIDATNAITQARLYDLVSIDSGNISNTTNHFLPTSFNGSWDIARCIVIGGNAVVTRNTTYTSGTINIDRLTHIGRTDYDALLINESSEIGTGTTVNLRSSIEYSLSPNAKRLADKLDAGTTNDVFDYLDYNNIYNLTFTDRYDTAKIKMTGKALGDAGFGGSDQYVDPQFVDTSVSLKKFDKTYGGDSTIQSLMSRLMQKNGFDTTGAVVTFDTDFTVGNLLNYFRTAYTPQNQALNGTGYSGVDVGAMDIDNSIPLEFSSKCIFVDGTLSGLPLDTTISTYNWSKEIYGTKTYNPATRSTLSGSHRVCATIYEGMVWMQPGDTLYIRGGAYRDSVNFIDYDNYTEANQGIIMSYPNEWAKLTGGIEYRAIGGSKWLTFRSFEIDSGFISILRAKHITCEYMYIHDVPPVPAGNEYINGGIVFGNSDEAAQNCTIKWCYLVNCYDAGVKFFADYGSNPLTADTNVALKRNKVLYNYIVGSKHGIHYKNTQFLCRDNTGADSIITKEMGDEIAYNIIENLDDGDSNIMVLCQDFLKFHNNIIKNLRMSFGEKYSNKREPFRVVCYNNTFISSSVILNHNNVDSYTGTYVVDYSNKTDKLHPYYYNVNNIYMDTNDIVAPLKLFDEEHDIDCDSLSINWNTVTINRNLFVPQTTGYKAINIGWKDSTYTVSSVNALKTDWRNWTGPDSTVYGYKVKNVTISGDTTTRNGGINQAHPYLEGTTIPNYIGANNDDSVWVDNVLNLANLSSGYVEMKTPATITVNPTNVSVYQGAQASFSVTATGSGTLQYQWYADNVAVDTATTATWSFIADTSQSGSSIFCVVSNDTLPPDTSSVVMLTVNAYTTPVLEYTSDSIFLRVHATGATGYQWFKDGVEISGETNSRLLIIADSTLYRNKPVYKCRVSNPVDTIFTNEWKLADNLENLSYGNTGINSLVQRLIVYTLFAQSPESNPPIITVQPRDTTVNEGQSAPFTITATNATGYQWYGNGELIPGATNTSYAFTATLAHNNSKIYCRVTNTTDTVWSDTATLTVTNDRPHYRTWISSSSTDMNLSTNYTGSGPLLTTDTLIFNNTSVVNATATESLSVAHVDIQSTYSGNWTMTGYSLTLNNGGLLRSGSGTFTLGNEVIFNGNGKLYTDATSGTNTSVQCVITFNGNDTADIDKELNVKGVVVNGHLYNMGAATFVITRNNVTTVVMGASGVLNGSGAIAIRSGASHNPFSFQPTSVFNPSGNVFVSCFNLSGTTITITLPMMNSPLATFALSCVANGGGGIYEFTGDFIFRSLIMSVGSASVDPMTFNTNSHLLKGGSAAIGSGKAGVKCYANLGSSTIKVNTFNTARDQLDSVIINCSGATFDANTEWTHGTYERLDGTYTIATPTDLFMGHSMLANSNVYSPARFYEENYSHRFFKNRAVSGTKIDNIFSRVDSCLTAYTPNRFFMWIGLNELNLEDVTKFDSSAAWYFTYWTQIISKVKTAGVDSIYIVEMAPTGTNASPMSATKQANFKRFNAALRDSCQANGLFFIATYDSLLQPGYTDRINPLYATDGIHPNSTIAGSEYVGYLFSLAQAPTVTFRQSVDTLKLVCSNNQNVESWQWYKNNVAISGATDSVLSVVVDSTSATKSVYYCEISNGIENKKVGDWTIERKANGRTVSRKNKYR